MNGMGYDPNGPIVPRPYFNEQPYFGWGDDESLGQPDVPKTDPGRMVDLVPPQAVKPSAAMKSELYYLKDEPMPSPQARETQMEPYNYEPEPNYYPRRPYINVEEAGGVNPTYPFADQVSIIPGEPITVRRRENVIYMKPEDVTGLGDGGPADAPAWQGPVAPVPASAAAAAPSIWDSIAKTITSVLPAAAGVAIKAQEAKYATALANATNRVAGQSVVAPDQYRLSTPAPAWYANPIVWVGGVLMIGGVAYVMTRK
jgi:hypothetical protein